MELIFGDGEVEESLGTALWFLNQIHLYGFDVDPLALYQITLK